jgi:hypothetical protein
MRREKMILLITSAFNASILPTLVGFYFAFLKKSVKTYLRTSFLFKHHYRIGFVNNALSE